MVPCCLSVHLKLYCSAGALTASVFDGSQGVIPQKRISFCLFLLHTFFRLPEPYTYSPSLLSDFPCGIPFSGFFISCFIFMQIKDPTSGQYLSTPLLLSPHTDIFPNVFQSLHVRPTSPLNFSNSEKYSRSQSTGFPVLFP